MTSNPLKPPRWWVPVIGGLLTLLDVLAALVLAWVFGVGGDALGAVVILVVILAHPENVKLVASDVSR